MLHVDQSSAELWSSRAQHPRTLGRKPHKEQACIPAEVRIHTPAMKQCSHWPCGTETAAHTQTSSLMPNSHGGYCSASAARNHPFKPVVSPRYIHTYALAAYR